MSEFLSDVKFGRASGILEKVPYLTGDDVIKGKIILPDKYSSQMLLLASYVLKSERLRNYPDESTSREIAKYSFLVLCPIGTLYELPEVGQALSEVLLFYNRQSPLFPYALNLHQNAIKAYEIFDKISEFLSNSQVEAFSTRLKTPGSILRSLIEHQDMDVFDIVGLTIIDENFKNSEQLQQIISQIIILLNENFTYTHTKINNRPEINLGLDNEEHVEKEDGYTGVHIYFRWNSDPLITIQIKFLTEPHTPDLNYLRYKYSVQ